MRLGIREWAYPNFTALSSKKGAGNTTGQARCGGAGGGSVPAEVMVFSIHQGTIFPASILNSSMYASK